ncbi:ABC transporter ATP-binding protein [Psychromonas arctica]|uniref:ABC transporter ATP-binding protein n=1 Tax=Psychromonas arctica TaxID=168275 RepID=UPI002FD03852
MQIEFSNFSFQYKALDKPTLKNINLKIEKGEKIVIIGASGSGKSTIGRCLNGLIPHAIKGQCSGQLKIAGKDTSTFEMHHYTEHVGTVLQDTDSQFVGLTVGEDIAFALENQCTATADMYPIVKSTAQMVELASLLNASPQDLSGGQKQRVSLAGILVDDVDVLLFDEPLAALDPKTSKKTIEIIDQLHRDADKTIIIIEHRLEDVLHRDVDRIILMDNGEIVADMSPDALLASSLLTAHGIREPLYLSALKSANCTIAAEHNPANLDKLSLYQYKDKLLEWFHVTDLQTQEPSQTPLLTLSELTYSYNGEVNAVDDVSFSVKKGEFVSILGKNGSGKSTLTKLIMGVVKPDLGKIILNDKDLAELSIFERSQAVGVVMQNPNHMISHHMIFDEIAFGLRNRGVDEQLIEQKVLQVLTLCGLKKYRHWPIDALSYGQKKRVTIASILVLEPELLILDEPTAGQDYRSYTAMLSFIKELNTCLGITVVIISHDMHLVLEYTTRSIVLSDSHLIADAPMTEVFSQPDLLAKANLTTTSLYELAVNLEIENTSAFMQCFIQTEQARNIA